ncbi:hypothetical protein PFY12_13295 [Chryseobacterium camelliae]|uniref:Uncharacterized protein n=1 Tax=Chryseobacterium camelliae TaxID=1265445 RepID=A0ABY7QK39_9FLAO|nr:hypothetical protein [Chryseobacterium camelliae]WBV60007.1 hypothetical protein PFY12_13295 [Chryseobacterium camelliae]
MSAHKPKVKVGNFGNVKTFYISEFNFGSKTVSSEELKMEVFGKLSQRIAEKYRYNDTILIERMTMPYYNEKAFFIIENDNSAYKLPWLDNGFVTKSNKKGLAIRIISSKVEVKTVLKCVEYAILNQKKLNRNLITVNFKYGEDNNMPLKVNSDDFINEIIAQPSALVEELMNTEILLLDNGALRTEISWKNNDFIFTKNTKYLKEDNVYKNEYVSHKVSDFKYYIDSFDSSYFIIFNDVNIFTYFDGLEENTSPKINVENNWYAFNLARENLGNKIILYDTNEYFYVYNINKKLLQKIE